jgi:hypothetical protein
LDIIYQFKQSQKLCLFIVNLSSHLSLQLFGLVFVYFNLQDDIMKS